MWRHGIVFCLAVALAACSAAPYTRRSQLILVSSEDEAKLGAQAFKEVLAKSRVDARPAVNQPVEQVGQRIARVANRPDYRWQFVVIDDPKQQNAFALPGGKVAVYTGLFPAAQSANGLAVVLGHEIAHVLARHGAERMSQGVVAQAGGTLLGAVLGGRPGSTAILAAYGLGTQAGVLLPYSRTQESEADHIGLLLMAQAGYDPRGALAFWQRMERSGGSNPPELLSTHPSHGTREQRVRRGCGRCALRGRGARSGEPAGDSRRRALSAPPKIFLASMTTLRARSAMNTLAIASVRVSGPLSRHIFTFSDATG
jgi:predicted Zn-dependent protease